MCGVCVLFGVLVRANARSRVRQERERGRREEREREVRVYEEVTGVSGEVCGLCGDPSGVVSASMAP